MIKKNFCPAILAVSLILAGAAAAEASTGKHLGRKSARRWEFGAFRSRVAALPQNNLRPALQLASDASQKLTPAGQSEIYDLGKPVKAGSENAVDASVAAAAPSISRPNLRLVAPTQTAEQAAQARVEKYSYRQDRYRDWAAGAATLSMIMGFNTLLQSIDPSNPGQYPAYFAASLIATVIFAGNAKLAGFNAQRWRVRASRLGRR